MLPKWQLVRSPGLESQLRRKNARRIDRAAQAEEEAASLGLCTAGSCYFFSFCKRKAGKTVSILCRARASLTHRSSRAFWNVKQSVVVNVTRHAYIISRPFHKYLLIITAFNKTLAPYALFGLGIKV
jgi:hypothetical protein